jgi:hypothetical protein
VSHHSSEGQNRLIKDRRILPRRGAKERRNNFKKIKTLVSLSHISLIFSLVALFLSIKGPALKNQEQNPALMPGQTIHEVLSVKPSLKSGARSTKKIRHTVASKIQALEQTISQSVSEYAPKLDRIPAASETPYQSIDDEFTLTFKPLGSVDFDHLEN